MLLFPFISVTRPSFLFHPFPLLQLILSSYSLLSISIMLLQSFLSHSFPTTFFSSIRTKSNPYSPCPCTQAWLYWSHTPPTFVKAVEEWSDLLSLWHPTASSYHRKHGVRHRSRPTIPHLPLLGLLSLVTSVPIASTPIPYLCAYSLVLQLWL